MNNIISLRPHHLLCIQKYTGHGYDEAFTQHMNELTACLKENPGIRVKLHEGCDYLCSRCPYNKDEKCLSGDKVNTMDESVLKICNAVYGEEALWHDFAAKALESVLHTDKFHAVCGRCQWYELCKATPV